MARFQHRRAALFSRAEDEERSPVDRDRQLPTRHSSAGLRLRLEAASPQRLAGGVKVTLTVTNPGPETRQFCDYHTPFEGIRNAIFEVSGPAGALEYQGPMVKRSRPRDDNFIVLAAGESASAEVDLRDGYALSPGRYTVRFPGNHPSLLDEGSNSVAVELLGD